MYVQIPLAVSATNSRVSFWNVDEKAGVEISFFIFSKTQSILQSAACTEEQDISCWLSDL